LLHVTDISWKRISSPEEIISIGETIKVLITKVSVTTHLSWRLLQLSRDSLKWVNVPYV